MSRHSTRVRAGNDRASLYTEITDKIIAELEAGRIPWVQPWGTAAIKAPLAMPRNSHRQTRIEQAAEGSFPFWVALVEEKCTGANYDKHKSFCQAHGLKLSRHGHSVVWQREWYCVFRFAEQEHAYRFMKEFGGDTWTAAPGYAVREHQDDNNTHERLAEEDATIALASTTAAKFTTSTSNP